MLGENTRPLKSTSHSAEALPPVDDGPDHLLGLGVSVQFFTDCVKKLIRFLQVDCTKVTLGLTRSVHTSL